MAAPDMTTPGAPADPAGSDDPPLYPPTVTPPEGPLGLPRFFLRFVRNPIATLPRQVYEQPVCRPAGDRLSAIWITDPGLTETILLRRSASFPKTALEQRIFGPVLGHGILTSDGEAWRWQRKCAAPMFRHAEILAYVPAMAAAGEAQLARWRGAAAGHVAAIDAAMTETTFDVITHTILAGCDAREGAVVKEAGQRFLEPISWPIAYAMLGLPGWLWHPGRTRMLRAAAAERAAVRELARRRRAEPEPRGDLLARLLAARHPDTGEAMSEDALVDNLATFLAAGHETTAKALTWTLYLLARAPAWQRRVRAEVLDAAGSRPITAADIAHLSVTQRVLKEAMRLYPPAPVLTRVAAEPVDLAGNAIAAGTLVVMPIFAIHRHRRLWDDPDRFDPDRFLPDREAAIPRTQYMPFGFGPRTCIGSSFAMIEATTLLATLVRGAVFEWDGHHAPEPVSRVTLRPRGGMPLRVTALDVALSD